MTHSMMREYMVARLAASKVLCKPAISCKMQPAAQMSAFASYALPCGRRRCASEKATAAESEVVSMICGHVMLLLGEH